MMISSRVVPAALLACTLLASPPPAVAAPAPAPAGPSRASPAWVQRSNEDAKVMLDLLAHFNPEEAGELGVDGFDDQVIDLQQRLGERTVEAGRAAAAELRRRLAAEQDPIVKQDLQILIEAAEDSVRGAQLGDKYDLPFFHVPEIVFSGIHALLDEQIAPARRAHALVRLRRYAGVEPGSTPIAELAKARFRERLGVPGLLGPPKGDVDRELAEASFYVDGVEKLLTRYKLSDAATMKKLRAQLDGYQAFVRAEVLPRARADFRLPPEEYAFALKQVGVDMPPAELAQQAHAAFRDLQQKMQALAPIVAKQRGWSMSDYRDVIRGLKKEQLVGEAILPHYQKRLADLEQIIRAHHLLTLPARAARVRLASEAESARIPAPNMHAPRLIGNQGELGEFLLPLRIPAKDGKTQQFDDFTFAAASWTLTAHEARPGHELQFASIIEQGVSVARAIFAFNSTNVEGWGLYAESIAFPYLPPEGQLVSLQHRMMRAARAFLDPELQASKITPAAAKELLMRDVVLSEALANEEVERYTIRSPGQATSYFYGYTRLCELRADTEKALGAHFDVQRFHDFILGQGLLPPKVLRQAVMTDFVSKAR